MNHTLWIRAQAETFFSDLPLNNLWIVETATIWVHVLIEVGCELSELTPEYGGRQRR